VFRVIQGKFHIDPKVKGDVVINTTKGFIKAMHNK